MARTFLRQDTQIRNSDSYVDNVAPTLANFETNPAHIQDDLNNIRSQLHNLLQDQAGNWYDDLNTPSALETGTQRGVNDLNTSLHAIEKKRVLRNVHNVGTDVTVPASQNYVILALSELPSNTTAAVGVVATLGTVVAAHGGSFGTHALSEVAGGNPLAPRNLELIMDASTGDPILSGGRQVYALIQTETATDGHTMTGTTPNRAQLSFVRPNATFDDLEAVPVADIENQVVNYCTRERIRLEDFNEYDFLAGAQIDIGAGAGTVDRQTAYNNQGATAVDLTTNATLDLEAAGIEWAIRDDAEAKLFGIIEGSAGGTSTVKVYSDTDTFDVDAVLNNFANGIAVDTGAASTTINVGVTANQIDCGGALKITSGGGTDLSLVGDLELNFTDSYRAGSTWSLADGISLADSSQEWTDFETNFGEVSLLSAITQAMTGANFAKTCANVTSTTTADTDVGGVGGGSNLDAQIHDMSGGDFLTDHDVFVNGNLLRGGANAAANNDYYPGTSLANGQLKFEFTVKVNDVLCVISRG